MTDKDMQIFAKAWAMTIRNKEAADKELRDLIYKQLSQKKD